VAFSPDGGRVLSGGFDETKSGGFNEIMKLQDTATGALTRTFEAHSKSVNQDVTSVVFSRDGARVLSGSGDHTISCGMPPAGR
jgi:WD40 repeat protein